MSKLDELQRLVDTVLAGAAAGDDEVAHSAEDALRKLALHAIAEDDITIDEAKALARRALCTEDEKFARWTA